MEETLAELDLTLARGERDRLASLGARLARAGFNERMVCAWLGVPLVSDARHVAPSARRLRRGLGGWIALFVAGEAVEAATLGVLEPADVDLLVAVGLVAREGESLRARASVVPLLGALVAADRLDARGPAAVLSPDVSAWNLAASLPEAARSLLDVGTGAGAAALVAARRGARVVGTDVDPRAIAFAELNALANGVAATFVEGDLFADVVGRFDVVAFNAPLARAELAGPVPLYLRSPEGEALMTRFLAGAAARVASDGEALLHAQLTPAIEQAVTAAGFRRRLSVEFADAPDGTPHALVSLLAAGAPRASRARVPLGPGCPHLRREVVERLHATGDLVAARYLRPAALGASVLRPPPWLELVRIAIHDGAGFRERTVRLGEHRLDGEELALLEASDGRTVSAVAPAEAALERLARLAERGLLVL